MLRKGEREMRKLFSVTILVLGVLMLSPLYAGTVTLSITDIHNFTLSASNNLDNWSDSDFSTSTKLNAKFFGTDISPVTGSYATFSTSVSVSYNTGDSFGINIFNNNENIWEFEVFINGTSAGSINLTALNGTFFTIDLDTLLGTSGGTITSVAVKVSPTDVNDTTPLIGSNPPDEQAELLISVPEPTSLILLGIGLLGSAILRRKIM